jgi:hypothetical protein
MSFLVHLFVMPVRFFSTMIFAALKGNRCAGRKGAERHINLIDCALNDVQYNCPYGPWFLERWDENFTEKLVPHPLSYVAKRDAM